MRAFVATSLKNTKEYSRVEQILTDASVDIQCCISDIGDLKGEDLFYHNYKGIVNADLFISLLKNVGKDVATEIGLACALGKKRIGVLYDLDANSVMTYYAAGELVQEEDLARQLEKTKRSSKNERLDFYIPTLEKYQSSLVSCISDVFASRRFVDGHYVSLLEKKLAERYSRHVVATASGTAGLMMVLDSITSQKGEVIVPSLSFSASVQAIVHAGNIPVFCDVNPLSWNVDPNEIRDKITKRTKAILAVNLFGVPCKIQEIEEIGMQYGVPVIYDSCQAFGARNETGEVGTFGKAEVFSLDCTKIVSGGLGGFVTTADKELAKKLKLAKNFGNSATRETLQRGINGRMLEFSAILALKSFEDFDNNFRVIKENEKRYREIFRDVPCVVLQSSDNSVTSPQYFAVLIDHPDDKKVETIKERLRKSNIEIRVYNPTNLHKLQFFCEEDTSLPITESMHAKLICLPTHRSVTDKHRLIIKKTLEDVLK